MIEGTGETNDRIGLFGQLISSQVFKKKGLDAALREVVEVGVKLLDVDRISIWLHDEKDRRSSCVIAYNRAEESFDSGARVDLSELASYSENLRTQHVIAVDDTETYRALDPVRDSLKSPRNIRALMEGVIHQDDRFLGTVIASRLDAPSKWNAGEIACHANLCQFVANLFERSSRQAAEARLQDWIKTSSVSQWEMDADLKYTDITESLTGNWGITKNVFIGKTRWDAVGASLDDPLWAAHKNQMEAHLPFRNFVYPLNTPEDGQKMVSISGTPVFDEQNNFIGYRGTTNDVSDLVGTELALKETEQRFKDLVDGSLQGIGVTVNHMTVFANTAFATAFGYEVDEVIGMRDIEFVAPDDRDYRLNYQARKSEGRKEMSGITKAGEIRHFEAFAKNVMWQGKEARLLTLFDITEKKIAEEHLRHAQKMEAVGELTGGIAHDFNNLLSVIMGNTEILESSVPESDEAARLNLANILRAAQGGADLTRRLLAFARRQPLRAERTDIHDLVDSLHSLFGHTIGKANELTTLFEEEQMIARVDPAQLENVLLNLAVNARDAMPEGGRITIRCSRASVIEVPDSTDDGPDPGDYIRIEVSDTGTGIPADIIDRVFDPFFTTKEVGKGTGLGLSMVFGFAKQSGGHVSISSRAGKGSTITLLVPKAT